MRHALLLIILLSGAALALSAALGPDPENLPNLQQPRPEIYTAGQPTETGFREAKSMGIKTVINVLPQAESVEGKLVADHRMTYISLPFETSNFKLETVRQFSSFMAKIRRPVLIHCRTGNHVGGLWYAYRVLAEKAPAETALLEARRIGLKPSLEEPLVKWVAQHKGARISRM